MLLALLAPGGKHQPNRQRETHPGPSVQLYEQLFWGSTSSNIITDPNPRLEAYIAAARRGATVRVLLDAFFDNQDLDSPRSNLRTVEYLTAVAQTKASTCRRDGVTPPAWASTTRWCWRRSAAKGGPSSAA